MLAECNSAQSAHTVSSAHVTFMQAQLHHNSSCAASASCVVHTGRCLLRTMWCSTQQQHSRARIRCLIRKYLCRCRMGKLSTFLPLHAEGSTIVIPRVCYPYTSCSLLVPANNSQGTVPAVYSAVGAAMVLPLWYRQVHQPRLVYVRCLNCILHPAAAVEPAAASVGLAALWCCPPDEVPHTIHEPQCGAIDQQWPHACRTEPAAHYPGQCQCSQTRPHGACCFRITAIPDGRLQIRCHHCVTALLHKPWCCGSCCGLYYALSAATDTT